MEFEGQYLTYQEYKALSGTLDEMPFNLLEFDARKRIDKRTFGRLVDKGQEYQDVKLCIFKLIPILQSYDKYNIRDKSISSVMKHFKLNYNGKCDMALVNKVLKSL